MLGIVVRFLTYLHLRDNRIVNVSPLGNLTNLTYLDLRNNRIASVQGLGSLTSLTYLSLTNNQIVDLSPLTSIAQAQGSSVTIRIVNNPLSQASINTHIPAMLANNAVVTH